MCPPTARALTRPLVIAAFALQLASYAALLAVFSVHGEAAPVVEALRALPNPLLAALSLPAFPAVAVSVVFGAALQATVGVSPFQLGTILLTPGDALVYLAAYLVAVGVGVGVDRAGRRNNGR